MAIENWTSTLGFTGVFRKDILLEMVMSKQLGWLFIKYNTKCKQIEVLVEHAMLGNTLKEKRD